MSILRIDQAAPLEADSIAPEKLLSGSGQTQLWHAFSDKTDQFHVGHWASEICEIQVSYTENELCVLMKGEAELIETNGQIHQFKQGEAFVIPAGFEGVWKSITPVVKIYAIFEPAS